MSIGQIYLPVLANFSHLEELLDSRLVPLALSLVEIALILVMLLLEIYNIYLFQAKNIFHINIKLCLYYYYLLDFLMSIARIAFISCSIFGTVSPLWVDVIASARVIYLIATVSGMPVFLLERSFATFYSEDYQQKRRVYIAFLCTILLNLLTFALNIHWLLTGNIINILIGSVVISGVGLTGYLLLVHYNTIRLRGMLTNRARYTLVVRYQIDENLRTFKVLRNAFCIYSCNAGLFLVTVVVPLFVDSPFLKELFHFFMEIVLSTLPAPIFICFILSYPSWKDDLAALLCCRQVVHPRSIVVRVPNQHEQDVYFKQLYASWNT